MCRNEQTSRRTAGYRCPVPEGVIRSLAGRAIRAEGTAVPSNDVTPESEARWQAWLAKGRARELRRNHRMKTALLLLVSGGAVAVSLALAIR